MDKPLYILIFLLLWSNRIRGGEEEDINGSFSPSTQKTGVRNSLIDKASTSTVTKKTTIFDPDSESAEKVSPPIKSKTLETNTGTVEPSVPNSNTPIPAKESTRKNTTTLSDTDPDSSETQSSSNKPEVPQTTNDSSETNSPPIKSEETETKLGASEIFLPNSVTIKPARDSTTVNTKESDPNSASKKAKTTPARDLDSEPPKTDSTSIKSEAPETEFEPSETDSTSIKSKAPETEFGTQQPPFHNFESHELADEPSETNTPPSISEAPELIPASTAKAKTATISDPNSESSVTDSPFIRSEAAGTKTASTTSTKTISDSESESSEVKPTFHKSKTSKTTTVDLRRLPRSSDAKPDFNGGRKTNALSSELVTPRSTRGPTGPIHTSTDKEEITKIGTTVSTQQTGQTSTKQEFTPLNCLTNKTEYLKNQSTTSITLRLSSFGNRTDLCLRRQPDDGMHSCKPLDTSSDMTISDLDPGSLYSFSVESIKNDTGGNHSCFLGLFHTLPRCEKGKKYEIDTLLTTRTDDSLTLNTTQLPNDSCIKIGLQQTNNYDRCIPATHSFISFQNLASSKLYKVFIFSYLNVSNETTVYSPASCLLGKTYTLPRDPNCTEYEIDTIVTSRTNDSLTLNTAHLTRDSCIQIRPKRTNGSDECIPTTRSFISFENLNSSTLYDVFFFSYFNVSNVTRVYSNASCLLGKTYTLPSNPKCSTIQKKVVNRNSTNILLKIIKSNSTDKKLCIKSQRNESRCTPTSESVPFGGLKPSTTYKFLLFSYIDESEYSSVQLLSRSNCSFWVHTRPSDPNCTDIKTITATNRTASVITLDFTPLSKTWKSLCIKIQSNMICRPLKYPKMRFDQLDVSTQYNFSVFSYDNDTEKKQLLSTRSCDFVNYTGPTNPDCGSVLIRNKTTNSIVLEVKNLTSSRYIVHLLKGYKLIKTNITLDEENMFVEITNLEPGTSYTFDIFAVNDQDIKSEHKCRQENQYTYPAQPTQSENIYVFKTDTKFGIQWNPPTTGRVDKYSIDVHCNCSTCCSCTPKFEHLVNKTTVNVTGLHAGTDCIMHVTAISGNLSSGPLVYRNIETSEKGPGEVSKVSVTEISSNGFTVSWSKPTEPNGHISKYNVNITGKTLESDKSRTIVVSQLPPKTAYNGLSPGNCYNVTIAAVNGAGEGKKKTVKIYTAEEVPSQVFNLTATNISSTSIVVTWLGPLHPNGVITQYRISVKKEEKENNTQQINFYCIDCQRPCPKPDFSNEGDNKAGIPKNYVNITRSNKTLQYEIIKLQKYTLYKITIQAFTAKGGGNETTITLRTSEDKPSPPGQPGNLDVQIYNVSFLYDKPNETNGIITDQDIEYTYMSYNVCATNQNVVKQKQVKHYPVIKKGHQFTASLEELKPFWNYTIRVRVSTSAGFSNYSESTTFQTLPTTPGKVTNITAENISSRHIYLSWTQPCHPNGIISNYTIEVTNKSDSSNAVQDIRFTNNTSTIFNVTNLLPYRSYLFYVKTQVQNVSSMSNSTTSAVYNTSTEAPCPPGKITIGYINSTSVSLSWLAPKLETGPTYYIVTATDQETRTNADQCVTKGFHNTFCIIHGLDSYWDYLLTVQANVDPYNASQTTIKIKTNESAPGKVSAFKVTQDINITAKTNVFIKWKSPALRDLNGVIQKYYLQYWYQPNKKVVKSYPSTQKEAIIKVEAEKMYTFQIFASNRENATNDDYVTKHLKIKPGAPLPPPKQKVPLINKGPPASDDQTQIAVAFSQAALCNNSNGEIVQWYIIVSKTPGVKVFRGAREEYSEFIQKTYKKWEDVYEKDVNIPYIASDSWNPHCESGPRRKRSAPLEIVSYTLGSDGDCESGNRKYCNGNLEPGQTYRVRYAVCTKGGCLESEFSEPFQTAPNHVPAIAGSLTAVVLVLAVIIVVIIVLKRRGKGPFKSLDNGEVGQQNEAFNGVEMKGTSKPKAVKIADFANYVQKLHADSNLLFSSEYKLLKETCPTHTTKAAEVQVNRIKNRYTNILSYDHSRVKLLPTEDDEGSDYINANYMPGYSSPREYIATQGPLPFTRDDFWRMIWEQNVSIIVMLTQLVERGRRKCDIYWPEAAREPVYYGDLVVELESESTLPDYVLRVMSIKLGDTRKTVKQFAYLAWPDMGIPETSEAMLKFAKEVRSHLPPPATSKGPMVVHCSAGVGRTGTFIAVDYLMQHVRTSDVIDIYSYVMKMRNNRPNMVQTEDQYVFIHDCIKDYVNKNDDDTDDEEEEEEKQEDQSIYMNV